MDENLKTIGAQKSDLRYQSSQDSNYNRRFRVVFILLGFSILMNIYSITSANQKGINDSNMLSRVQSLVDQAEQNAYEAEENAYRAQEYADRAEEYAAYAEDYANDAENSANNAYNYSSNTSF